MARINKKDIIEDLHEYLDDIEVDCDHVDAVNVPEKMILKILTLANVSPSERVNVIHICDQLRELAEGQGMIIA